MSQENETPVPELLDVVRLDGRWAQAISYAGQVVRYVDDRTEAPVDWNDYDMVRKPKGFVSLVIKNGEGEFREDEIQNIHWGPEEDENPALKLQVRVFGEYERK